MPRLVHPWPLEAAPGARVPPAWEKASLPFLDNVLQAFSRRAPAGRSSPPTASPVQVEAFP
jgi:hypothetical protein